MRLLSPAEERALREVSASLGVQRDWLYALINFESGFNPGATNKITGARGLIQFLPSTAQSLGYAAGAAGNAADTLVAKNPNIESQLRFPVLSYLTPFKPFPTDYSLFMAVFYPKARGWSPATPFPDSVRAANPGLTCPRDYVDLVYRHAKMQRVAATGSGFFLLTVAVAAIYLYHKRRKGTLHHVH